MGNVVRVLALVAYGIGPLTVLELSKLSVLICNVDVVLDVLVLERELALADEICLLDRLSQI